MRTGYAIQNYNAEKAAKAISKDLPISTKHSVEICSFIKNRKLQTAKKMLNEVMKKEIAVPYKRYKHDVAHRKGSMATGRYPVKASGFILQLLESVEKNAQNKGLSTNDLVITHICANRAARPYHYGRHRVQTKRSHVEIMVEEMKKPESKDNSPKQKKEVKK